MKTDKMLYILLVIIHFIWLTNFTLLKEKWSGIAMMASTGIFIFATAMYLMNRQKGKE